MAFPGEEVVDEDFLIALATAEAAAVDPSKRRRLSTTSSTSSPTPATPEGPYLAALKGSHSSSWQQQQETLNHKRPGGSKTLATPAGGSGGGGGGGACFKCGDTTHWARDCPQSVPAGGGGGGAFGVGSGGAQVVSGACFKCGDTTHWARDCPQSVPASGGGGGGGGGGGISGGGGGYVDAGVKVEDKACPCGAGTCLVLTSNTARNPGRKFYKCPMRDNGGCSFFEWCDSPSPGSANVRSNSVFQSNTSVAEMLCPCGAGACLILTAKTGMNAGRQFYRCPDNQGGTACSFFKWCDEQQLRTAAPLQVSPQYQANVTSSGQNTSKKSSSSCFKCGQDNHWAKDCPNQSSDPLPAKGGKTFTSASSPDACFKCGKTGHWSRDCPSANCGSGTVASHAKSSSTFGSWNSHRS